MIEYLTQLARSTGESAAEYQRVVAWRLRRDGWRVELEVPQDYTRKDGRLVAGRIDIVASRAGHVLALELDAKSVRDKSRRKLAAFKADTKAVLLRATGSAEVLTQ